MHLEVTTWYLDMRSPAQCHPKYADNPQLSIVQAKVPSPELSRFLYTAVGGNWYWLDRLSWTYSEWLSYLKRPQLETWVAYLSGTPAGYVELEAQPAGNIEIVYFGLLPQFIGQGIGGHLLTHGIERAWEMGGKRVWVHTCSLDGPQALRNYLRRGFQLYHTETQMETLPDQPVGPWVGAYGTLDEGSPDTIQFI